MADWADVIKDRLTGLNLNPVREAEIVEELSQHLEDRYHELLSQSLSDAEARETAIREAGNISGDIPNLAHELIRIERAVPTEPEVIGGPSMNNLLADIRRDFRYAIRSLIKARGFTAVALICLALGTGGATTIFSVVRPVLLRPLPYQNPDRLCVLFKEFKFLDVDNAKGAVPPEDYVEWKSAAHSFDGIEAFSPFDAGLAGGDEALRIQATQVTPGLFSLLGASPAMGRTFSDQDATPDIAFSPGGDQGSRPLIAMISNRLWRSFFGSDKDIVGRSVKLDESLVTVIGVMPPGFNFPDKTDLWVPIQIAGSSQNAFFHNVIAELKDGVSRKQGLVELQGISDRLGKSGQNSLAVSGVSLRDYLAGDLKLTLLVLFIAAGFVLLIACANVASLLVARGASQKREIAIRASLGASRGRILRQLLTESIVLSLAGATAGTLLAVAGVKAFVALIPVKAPGLQSAAIDGWVLAFSLMVALATGLLFGLAPALLASFADTNRGLKDSGAGFAGASAGRSRLSRLLVATEIAFAIILLAGAGLMIRSFVSLTNTRLGFNAAGVYTMNVSLPFSVYKSPVQMTAFYEDALERIRSLPGVTAVGMVSNLPLGTNGLRVFGDFTKVNEQQSLSKRLASKAMVSSDYFKSMSIPLIAGRGFTEADTMAGPPVTIISEGLAKEVWPNGDALGQRIDVGFGDQKSRTIVGIVGDIRQDQIRPEPELTIYIPSLQADKQFQLGDMTFTVKSDSDLGPGASDLRAAIASLDKSLPVYDIKPMREIVSDKVADPRFYTSMLSVLAALALILAAAGVYGVVSYSVGQRTHEIGIRVALGAEQRQVLWMFVRGGFLVSVAGACVGLAGAYALTRFIAGFLYQTSPTDTTTLACVCVVLVAVAVLASFVPARRASRVDPSVALRCE